jgi:hypothetical protein
MTDTDYGLFNFSFWLIGRLKKSRDAMSDVGVCTLLGECRRILKGVESMFEQLEVDYQSHGLPKGHVKTRIAVHQAERHQAFMDHSDRES